MIANLFFETLQLLHQFTLNLDANQTCCKHCQKSGHLQSHGQVTKYQNHGHCNIVGKRIICSKRFGRKGCGRTQQLYVVSTIPKLHKGAESLSGFVSGLSDGLSVERVCKTMQPGIAVRTGYRWVGKLADQLSCYRTYLMQSQWFVPDPPTVICQPRFQQRKGCLQHLLPTLCVLKSIQPQWIEYFQLSTQQALLV